MGEKLLTIIVPSYNMEEYLPKCLGSLEVSPDLMAKMEVIVVNDGSTDRTGEIAHAFASKWPETFRVIDKANGHYGSCVNAALPEAHGKYVRILDADDYVETSGLRDYLDAIANVTADVIISQRVSVTPSGEVIEECKMDSLPPLEVVSIGLLNGARFLTLHEIAYRRKLFDGDWYSQLEGIQYTDCQWSSEPMLRVSTAYYVPKVVTCYLVGREGQSVDGVVRLKSIRQQMRVDLRLAEVHAAGRPSGIEDDAWRYFTGFYFSELSILYSLAIMGNDAGRLSCELLKEFERELKSVDPQGFDEVVRCKYAAIGFGRVFAFRFVKSFREDSPCIMRMRYFLFRCYVTLRSFFGRRSDCCVQQKGRSGDVKK